MRCVPRVARRTEVRILGCHTEGMLMQVRLANDDCTGCFEARYHGCIRSRITIRNRFRTAGSLCPSEVDDVLNGYRHPVEQSGVFAAYRFRALHAFLAKQRDKGVELRLPAFNLGERRLHQFHRRDVAAREFGYGVG